MAATILSLLTLIHTTTAIDNGLGITPPMGWRSWNCYHGDIDQPLMENVIDAMLAKNGDGTLSYYDMGYTEVGVDDNWQICLANGTAPNHYFHNDTAPNGWAILDTQRFPDLDALVQYAQSRKVRLGWYMNNCICNEQNAYPANEVNDVAFLRRYDFDGIKLDGCSSSKNISNWQRLINETGSKPLLTENCHNGPNYANLSWCPMNLFRSSGDINPDYTRIIGNNLQSVLPFAQYPGPAITRPGCMAYPDMLEVGNIEPQYNATSYSMDRTHFGAWCVVSAPLIIGYDVTNTNITARVWDILSNSEAIAVSQTWAGHPGTLLTESEERVYYEYPTDIRERVRADNSKYAHSEVVMAESTDGVEMSVFQVWGKPMENGAWAVLLMNNDGNSTHDLTLDFGTVPGLNGANVGVRSIWEKKDLGAFSNSYTAKGVLAFDSEFLMLTPA